MKKIIIIGLVAGLLCINSAFASEVITKVSPGVTPDNPLYAVDKLMENIKISLASDADKEAELLLQIAQERLVEAQKMTDKEKIKYVNKLIDSYFNSLNRAEEKVCEVILDEKKDEKIKENLSEKLEKVSEVNANIRAILDEEIRKKLDDKKDEIYLAANIVRDLDIDKVKVLRKEGLGYGQISQVFLLADQSSKPIEEIATLFSQEDKGFVEIAEELDINPLVIKFKVIEKKQERLEEILKQAKANENEKIVDKLERKLEELEERKKKQEEKLKEKSDDGNVIKHDDNKKDEEEKKLEKRIALEKEEAEIENPMKKNKDGQKDNMKDVYDKEYGDKGIDRIKDIIPNHFIVTRGKVRRFR